MGIIWNFGLNCLSFIEQDLGNFTGDFWDRNLILFCFILLI